MTKEQFYLGGDSSGESLEDCTASTAGEEAFRPANVIDVQNLAKKQEERELFRFFFCGVRLSFIIIILMIFSFKINHGYALGRH